MTLMHAWLIRVSGVGDQVFKHKYDTGLLSWLIQCWDIVQSEREGCQRCQTKVYSSKHWHFWQ